MSNRILLVLLRCKKDYVIELYYYIMLNNIIIYELKIILLCKNNI